MSTAVSTLPVPDVHADLMDCLQCNLAVLADEWHGPGTHLRLGAPLRLRRGVTASGLPTAEPGLDAHVAEARELLGLVPVRRSSDVPAAGLTALLRPDGPTYVVADAYHLSWTPYARQRHMPHSFLIVPAADGSGEHDVVDAYHNDTPWGRARPVRFRLDPGDAPVTTAPLVQEVIWFDAAPLAPAPGPSGPPTPEQVAAFLAPYRAVGAGAGQLVALDRLVLESWLLYRSRRLHAAHTGTVADPAVAAHLADWAKVSEQLYLAMRRARRHADVPAGVLARFAAVLLADIEVFGGDGAVPAVVRPAPGPGAGRTTDPRWPDFATFLATTLDTTVATLAGITSLTEVPTTSSLRIVEIVEGLESGFGARFTADDLDPERLHDLDHLLSMIPTDEVTT